MKIKILNSPLIMSWITLLLKYGMGILLLPVVTRYLDTNELAFFFYINTILGLSYLAEGGINRSILRALAYFLQGVNDLPDNFSDIKNLESGLVSYEQIGKLIRSSFLLYILIGLVSSLVICSIGFIISRNILDIQPNYRIAKISYFLLSVYAFIYLMSLRVVSLLQGIGKLPSQKQIETIMGVLKIILISVSVILGFGILGIVIVMIVNISITLLIYHKLFYHFFPVKKITKYLKFDKTMIKNLWPSMWKQSLLAWGSYLILQGSSLLVAQIHNSSLIASYLFTLQLIGLLLTIANAPSSAYYPNVAQIIANKNMEEYKNLIVRSLLIAFIIYVLGVLFLLLFGNSILDLFDANTRLLSKKLFLFISLIYFLELNHTIHATYYTATNHIPFVLPSLISGILIILFGMIFVNKYGLFGILFIRFIVQLCFNNWYPIYLNYKLIKFNSETGLRM